MNIARTALKGVTYHNRMKTNAGYTLFCLVGSCDWTSPPANVWLIDMEGDIVNRWRLPSLPGMHALLLPNGHLLCAREDEATIPTTLEGWYGYGGEIEERDWDGNLVWTLKVPRQTHDFLLLPNDHIMYPTYADPQGIVPDGLAAKWKGGLPGTEVKGKIYGDTIVEVDRDGKVLWEWLAYEHLDPDIDIFCPLEARSHFHINSLWHCQDGNILVSMRWLSAVFKIEYPSGKVLARYGRGSVFHQHDARELDNGNILIFDNGSDRHGYGPAYSRVVEINPNTNAIVWEYKAENPSDFYSALGSGCERLPNGNTVICEYAQGRVFEVTYDHELVWEYVNPFMGTRAGVYKNWLFRAHRYLSDYPGFEGKDLDPARFPLENRLFGRNAFRKNFTPCIF